MGENNTPTARKGCGVKTSVTEEPGNSENLIYVIIIYIYVMVECPIGVSTSRKSNL